MERQLQHRGRMFRQLRFVFLYDVQQSERLFRCVGEQQQQLHLVHNRIVHGLVPMRVRRPGMLSRRQHMQPGFLHG